jgi:hypothetical protein
VIPPGPAIVTKSESATFHRSVELPPLSTHESAVKDMTFGQAGATATGRTVTTAVLVIVCGEQPSLVAVRV